MARNPTLNARSGLTPADLMAGFQDRKNFDPLLIPRTLRIDRKRILTSGDAGKVLPLAVFPILREDEIRRGNMTFAVEMMETAETLMNGVTATVNVHFVPYLAFERFSGMDDLNRSYKGVAHPRTGEVIPFIVKKPYDIGTANEPNFYRTLGLHAASSEVNSAYLEAYNTVVNYRREQRSRFLPLRAIDDVSLAEAFWNHTHMKHIVPEYDQALVDGEVPLSLLNDNIRVSGIGLRSTPEAGEGGTSGGYTAKPEGGIREADNSIATYDKSIHGDDIAQALAFDTYTNAQGNSVLALEAELADSGLSFSLSNLEAAKRTAAFARLRQRYAGHDDEYIIDMLMDAIRVPEEAMERPILLQQITSVFNFNERYATNSEALDEHVTTGTTVLDLNFRLPASNTGGIVIITMEIVPEQLFERQMDVFLHQDEADDFPQYLRDELDPEKVAMVTNAFVDTSHEQPNELFGFAPLNHHWMRQAPNIGGKYFRGSPTATFDEDRQKIWSVETPNPTLTEDFYLTRNFHHKVFKDTETEHFEIMGRGELQIIGNTVFGAALHESADDYEKVLAKIDFKFNEYNSLETASGNPPDAPDRDIPTVTTRVAPRAPEI